MIVQPCVAPRLGALEGTTRRWRACTCGSSSPRIAGAGERMAVEAAGIYLDYSKNRVTDETLDLLLQLARQSGLQDAHRGHVPRRRDQRLGEPRGASRGTARAAGRVDHCRRRGTSCPRSTPFWTGWRSSPIGSAAAPGRVIPAGASAT